MTGSKLNSSIDKKDEQNVRTGDGTLMKYQKFRIHPENRACRWDESQMTAVTGRQEHTQGLSLFWYTKIKN